MALRLDHVLEPGERVVWRGQPSRRASLLAMLPRLTLLSYFILVLWLLPRLAYGAASPAPLWINGLYYFSFALFLLAVFIALGGLSVPREAALTERRLLKLSGLIWPRVTELALARIVRLRVTGLGPSGLAVEGDGRARLQLEQIAEPRALLSSLAEMTGLPLVLARQPRAARAGILLAAAGLWGVALSLAVFSALLFLVGDDSAVLRALNLFGWAGLFVGVVLLGRLLSSLAMLLYLRRFVTAGEMNAAIHGRIEGAGPALEARFGRRTQSILAWLAGLVYGQPVGPGDGG